MWAPNCTADSVNNKVIPQYCCHSIINSALKEGRGRGDLFKNILEQIWNSRASKAPLTFLRNFPKWKNICLSWLTFSPSSHKFDLRQCKRFKTNYTRIGFQSKYFCLSKKKKLPTNIFGTKFFFFLWAHFHLRPRFLRSLKLVLGRSGDTGSLAYCYITSGWIRMEPEYLEQFSSNETVSH